MTQLKLSQSHKNSKKKKSKPNLEVNSSVSPWLARILYPLGCYIVLPLFFGKITITGQENIPQKEPVIVAPTHRSRWDALLVPYAVGRMVSGRDLRFMVTVDEVKGIQGWFIRRMGGFPIDTRRPQMESVRHSIELLQKDREMVVIFPEGGIFNDDRIHPLKRGAALIALEAEADRPDRNVKILPITIRYSQPYPSWGTNVQVNIGSPLNVKNYLDCSLRQGSQKLTMALQTSLEELYKSTDI